MPKLSIIVPVYNAERYLQECMQSLLGQTCRDIEIILVNDGSTDGSSAMCDNYRSSYPDLVKVIHQENRGQSSARNAGLDAVSGEWVCFVDSDDWVEPDMAEVMLSHAEENDADVHVFGFIKEYVDYSIPRALPEMTLPENVKKNYIYQNEVNLVSHVAVWSKLYRKAFLSRNNIEFGAGIKLAEDQLFMLYVMHLANKVKLHSKCLYHYRAVSSGVVGKSKFSKDRLKYALLFQNWYADFVDKFFEGTESHLMKQSDAVRRLIYVASYYREAGFRRKEMIGRLREHLQGEPLKTAVKALPLSLIPKRRRWQVLLLRMGLTALWVDLFRFADWLWLKKTAGRGHEMFP